MSGSLTGVLGLALFLIAGAGARRRRDFDIRELPPAGERDRTDRDQAQRDRREPPCGGPNGGRRRRTHDPQSSRPPEILASRRPPAGRGVRRNARGRPRLSPRQPRAPALHRLGNRQPPGRRAGQPPAAPSSSPSSRRGTASTSTNGQIKVTLNDAGEVLQAGTDDVVPMTVTNARRLTAEEAIAAAYGSLRLDGPLSRRSPPPTAGRATAIPEATASSPSPPSSPSSRLPPPPAAWRTASLSRSTKRAGTRS